MPVPHANAGSRMSDRTLNTAYSLSHMVHETQTPRTDRTQPCCEGSHFRQNSRNPTSPPNADTTSPCAWHTCHSISTQILAQVPKLAKKISQVRERLDNSLVASLDTSAEKVLQFLGQEEEKLNQHKDRSTKLMEYQVLRLLPEIHMFSHRKVQTERRLRRERRVVHI